jgi:hypothetical protein
MAQMFNKVLVFQFCVWSNTFKQESKHGKTTVNVHWPKKNVLKLGQSRVGHEGVWEK